MTFTLFLLLFDGAYLSYKLSYNTQLDQDLQPLLLIINCCIVDLIMQHFNHFNMWKFLKESYYAFSLFEF